MKRLIDKTNGHPIFKMTNKEGMLMFYVVHIVNPKEKEGSPNRFFIHTYKTLLGARRFASSLPSATTILEAHQEQPLA